MDRVETGKVVRDRLAGMPKLRRAEVTGVDLFVQRGFLAADVRQTLIALIDADRSPSRLFADNPDPQFRTSETCNLDPRHPAVRAADAALADLTGLDPRLAERLQGQRYVAGQEFKPHHDYLRATEPYWPRQQRMGGQRTWTAMVFLDAPMQGGETHFPRLDLTIPPRPGSLVIWNNLDAAGEPNPLTLHQGMPVVSGVKHIVTRWWRERPWAVSADQNSA
jgi:prolyl 4-hydroxylase